MSAIDSSPAGASFALPSLQTSGEGVDRARAAGAVADDVLLVSVLLVLMYAGSGWALDIPLKILCGGAIILRRWRRSAMWWAGVTALIFLVNGTQWYTIDNHKYLIAYWVMSVAIAVSLEQRGMLSLASLGRWLIGLCFGFAMVWKVVGGEFLDGSFLHNTFLTDSRVSFPLSVVGGVGLGELSDNRSLSGYLMQYPAEGGTVEYASSATAMGLGVAASYWTLFIEGAVAVLWLGDFGRRWRVWRHVALMVFIVTTYGLLPVVGFASVLCVMGFATLGDSESNRRMRAAYLILLGITQLFSVPWGGIVSDWMTR